MLKKISTNFIAIFIITNVCAENLMDGAKPIVGTHDGRNFSKQGTLYANTVLDHAKLSNLIDGSTTTSIDTFGSKQQDSHSFFGVLWPQNNITNVSKVSINVGVYKDGGWFGKNSFLPTNKTLLLNQAISKGTEPIVQVTNNLGKTWKAVRSTSNYLAKMSSQHIKDTPTYVKDITFTINEKVSNINGIRVIGSEGGSAGGDRNGFVGLSDFKVEGKKKAREVKDGNIAITGYAISGHHSGRGIDKLGTPYANKLNPASNIIDGNPSTFCDTWAPSTENLPYSYIGILWHQPIKNSVQQLEITINAHYDGGWFGTNSLSPEPGAALETNHIAETSVPLLQVSYDKGKSWRIVSNKNNYLIKMVGHKTGDKASPSPVTIHFIPDSPLSNIDGIRLIGSEGGGVVERGKDTNGFISVAELKVLTSEAHSELSSGIKYNLNDNVFSWEVENEGWIKEFRVVNLKTGKPILITPAVDADIYSIEISSGVIPQLQIIDKYDKTHEPDLR